MSNVILRPVFNRPEMLTLSLEYEAKAREKWSLISDKFTTLFLVEHGADAKTKELIKNYPFPAKYVIREKKYGLTVNILEGMKSAFQLADDFIIHLEDDILLHEDYFLYMSSLISLVDDKPYSVLSPFCHSDDGDTREINRHNHYAALAPLISKDFFVNYINKHATAEYYSKPSFYVTKLNNAYEKYWDNRVYKYTNAAHHEQAGLINRLVDVAIIEEERYMYAPRVNRQQHIGYFGKNRPGGKIPGQSYEDRVKNLREIILDADKMYELSATKQYNDYKVFSPKLNDWDGTLFLKGYAGTAKNE